MAELVKKSLNTAKSLAGAVGRGIAWNWNLGQSKSPEKVLGQIYETMLKIQEEQDIDHELAMRDERKKEKNESDRNAALIKALTARKKPKAKKPPKKKEEVKKPEEKPAAKKKEETSKKKDEAVKKQVDKESDKAKQQAQRESDKAKKTAEKEQAAAKKKVEEEAKPKAEPVKPPEVKPKAEAVPKAPEVKPPPTAAKKGVSVLPSLAVGAAATVASSLASAGVTEKGQANILAQVKAESGFVPKSENLNYSSAERIQQVFGKKRIPTLEFAQKLVNNPEALANHVYATTDGNSEPGDGWKYRGRGYIQITGKNAYKSLGQYLKIDLLSNPDLLNTPEIASKSIPWFFLKYKSYITKGDPKSLENISIVNKAVGFADKKLSSGEMESEHRMKLAEEFEKQKITSAPAVQTPPPSEKVASLSKENIDLNENLKKQQTTTVNNVDASTTQQPSSPIKQAKVDDRSPMQKKMQG